MERYGEIPSTSPCAAWLTLLRILPRSPWGVAPWGGASPWAAACRRASTVERLRVFEGT